MVIRAEILPSLLIKRSKDFLMFVNPQIIQDSLFSLEKVPNPMVLPEMSLYSIFIYGNGFMHVHF